MTASLQKLAALGAYAVCAGLVVVFAFLCWVMWPGHNAGMNTTMLVVGMLCVAIPVALIIAIHIALAKQLSGHITPR